MNLSHGKNIGDNGSHVDLLVTYQGNRVTVLLMEPMAADPFHFFAYKPAYGFALHGHLRCGQLHLEGLRIQRTLALYGFGDLGGDFHKALGLCGGHPGQVKPVFTDAREIQQFPGQTNLLFRLYITFQVMAITNVSAAHQYPVPSLLKGLDDERGINAP